jgi:hypothetical protein
MGAECRDEFVRDWLFAALAFWRILVVETILAICIVGLNNWEGNILTLCAQGRNRIR